MHSLCYLKGHKVLVGRSSLYMGHINTTPTFRMFGPEQWGQVDRFKQFYEGTFSFPSHIKKAVSGVGGHFEKAGILIELANNLAPSLEKRYQGASPEGRHAGHQFSADFGCCRKCFYRVIFFRRLHEDNHLSHVQEHAWYARFDKEIVSTNP